MDLPEPLRREPLRFLLHFCLAAAVLFLLRPWMWSVYLATVVPVVNLFLSWWGGAVLYEVDRQVLALVYTGLGLRFTIHDIIYQNLIVAVALFIATPGGWRWRLGWIAIVVAVLWFTHLVSLFAGGRTVIWDYIHTLDGLARRELAARVAQAFPPASDWFYSRLFGLWHTWGRPAVALVIWLLAAGEYLRLWRRQGRGREQTTDTESAAAAPPAAPQPARR